MDKTDAFVNLAILEELRQARKAKQTANELVTYLADSLRWVLHYCAKNDLPLPDHDKISRMIERSVELEQAFNSQSTQKQPTLNTYNKDTDKLTEPAQFTHLSLLIDIKFLFYKIKYY